MDTSNYPVTVFNILIVAKTLSMMIKNYIKKRRLAVEMGKWHIYNMKLYIFLIVGSKNYKITIGLQTKTKDSHWSIILTVFAIFFPEVKC